jgi:predicted GIY-YIG superfamily endonuclease
LLNYIFDGQFMELTTNYRVIASGASNPSSRIFYEQLDKARLGQKIDKHLFGNVVCDFALAWSNKNVDSHNKMMMQKKSQDIQHEKLSDDMYLYVGLPIIACNTYGDYVNNEDFIIVSYDDKKIVIKNERQEIEITRETLLKDFKAFYACTVHKAQGMEFNFPYTIYGWSHMSPNMLYTAISRSTCIENVNLVYGIKNTSHTLSQMRCGYVYMYTNVDNGMSYVGSTFNIEERKKQHAESHSNDKFHKAIRQYGIKNFDFVILAEYDDISDRELRQLEGQWIHNYSCIVNGYNSDNIKNEI